MSKVDEVLQFWFGDLDERGIARQDVVKRWFIKSDEFDREIEERFGLLRKEVMAGEHDDWLNTPDGTVAFIVVLDQFSRNLGRGTPVMYEADEQALSATHDALGRGLHLDLGVDHAVAILMPLMHSEELSDQERCVELFQEMAARYPDLGRIGTNVDYAIKHWDVVRRWGRFPHRNAILARKSTPEELEFLEQPGSSF